VMVVGGGDSALEAAIALAELPDTTVTLVHRGTGFTRARAANRLIAGQLGDAGMLNILFDARPIRISPDEVIIERNGDTLTIANDAVIVCAGGTLPREWLARIGIVVETHHGLPVTSQNAASLRGA